MFAISFAVYIYLFTLQAFRTGGSDWDSYSSLFNSFIALSPANISQSIAITFANGFVEPYTAILYFFSYDSSFGFATVIIVQSLLSFFANIAGQLSYGLHPIFMFVTFPVLFANTMGVRIHDSISVYIITYCLVAFVARAGLSLRRAYPMFYAIPLFVHLSSAILVVTQFFNITFQINFRSARFWKIILPLSCVLLLLLFIYITKYGFLIGYPVLSVESVIRSFLNYFFQYMILRFIGYRSTSLACFFPGLYFLLPLFSQLQRGLDLAFCGLVFNGLFAYAKHGLCLEEGLPPTQPVYLYRQRPQFLLICFLYSALRMLSAFSSVYDLYDPCFYCARIFSFAYVF